MKNCIFPMGEPTLFGAEHLSAFLPRLHPLPWTHPSMQPWLGWLLVRILAPKKMPLDGRLPPFLQYRTTKGTLVFPLCSRCAELQSQKKCRHNEFQRSWIGAFSHLDLELALKLGYKILEIFEVIFTYYFFLENLKVWHWSKEQWLKGEEGPFGEYINSALKLKVK